MADQITSDCWVGFDLGGTKMLAVVFDADFKPLGRERKKTKGFDGVEAGLERVQQTIRAALESAGVAPERVRGIGVGCPGPLDLEKGIMIDAPNLGWSNVRIKKELEAAFGWPAVIANDVDLGVYGEYRFGAGQDARCVLGVFPGTGVGGGCVYEGNIIQGKQRSCMEIGHVRVICDGPLCGCGRRGCLEAVSSRLAISAAAAQAAYRGQAPNLRKKAGTDLREIRSGTLAEAIAAGDEVIERIVRDAAQHIGTAVGGFVHLLAPDVVVLGGGLVEAMPKLIVETVERAAKEWVLPSYVKSFKVVPAKLGDDAAVMGAAAWARRKLQNAVIAEA